MGKTHNFTGKSVILLFIFAATAARKCNFLKEFFISVNFVKTVKLQKDSAN